MGWRVEPPDCALRLIGIESRLKACQLSLYGLGRLGSFSSRKTAAMSTYVMDSCRPSSQLEEPSEDTK